MGSAAPIIAGAVAILALSRLLRRDQPTPDTPLPSGREQPTSSSLIWPIDEREIKRYGDTVTDRRPSTGKPHKGIDIFAPARTLVRSISAGSVVRVVDGRVSDKESSKAAGLWIDIKGNDGLIYRYLHLGLAYVKSGDVVKQGAPLGYIAPANTSGLGNDPHLHFEIRQTDFTQLRGDYGTPIDPLTKLPPLRRQG